MGNVFDEMAPTPWIAVVLATVTGLVFALFVSNVVVNGAWWGLVGAAVFGFACVKFILRFRELRRISGRTSDGDDDVE